MTSTAEVPDLLAGIVAATRRIVELRTAAVPRAEMERKAAAVEPAAGAFRTALEKAGINVIAECKRRSPSRGILMADYDPAAVARGYAGAGAAAISVLTEPTFFDGSLAHLTAVRGATSLPVLRKDFIVDSYQILEARASGASAVLLIVAALTPAELRRLHRDAADAGLDVLVEIHGLDELARALDAGASIVGVNNRNLRTLAIDTAVSRRAIEMIPESVLAVAESGLKTGRDLRDLSEAGYDAFLMGERFMTTANPGQALAGVLKDARGNAGEGA